MFGEKESNLTTGTREFQECLWRERLAPGRGGPNSFSLRSLLFLKAVGAVEDFGQETGTGKAVSEED